MERYWQENRRLWGERKARADAWSRRRYQLAVGDRVRVAERLGLSVRTLERFEIHRAPGWYDFALVGLWAEDRVREHEKAS